MATDFVAESMERGLHLIPQHMQGAIKRYILNGIPPGNFLSALLQNDFMAAVGRADEDNAAALKGWAMFFYNYIPSGSYGSPDAYAAWISKGGHLGSQQAAAQ